MEEKGDKDDKRPEFCRAKGTGRRFSSNGTN